MVQGLLTEVPAVSFDNDGAPEVVISDETGVLVPYGHIDGLTVGAVTLLRDEDLRKRLGRRGRKRCLSMFDWQTMVEQLDALYVGLSTRGST